MVKYIVIGLIIIIGGFLLWPKPTVSNKEPTELAKGINSLYQNANGSSQNDKQASVINLYATSWCGYCAKARSLFKQKGVRYIEYDIEKDNAARARYNNLGGRGVPLVEADGQVIRGYNESSLRKLASEDKYKL